MAKTKWTEQDVDDAVNAAMAWTPPLRQTMNPLSSNPEDVLRKVLDAANGGPVGPMNPMEGNNRMGEQNALR